MSAAYDVFSVPRDVVTSFDWRDEAACLDVDSELFFPVPDPLLAPDRRAAATAVARAFCGGCPVRQDCLAWALETEQRFGVWGGLDLEVLGATERAALR